MFGARRWIVVAVAVAACGGVEETMARTERTAVIRGRVTQPGSAAAPLPDLRAPGGEARPASAGSIRVDDVRLDQGFRGEVRVTSSASTLVYVNLSAADPRVQLPSQEGDVPPGGTLAFDVLVDPRGLPPGIHQREVRLRCDDGMATARVEFSVLPPGEPRVRVVAYDQGARGLPPVAEALVPCGEPGFELWLAPGSYLLEAAPDDGAGSVPASVGGAGGGGGYRVPDGRRAVRVGAGERVEGVELELPGRR